MIKLTQEEFIEKARKIHGDKYIYKKVKYKNYRTKVSIICRSHGVFLQKPKNHIHGMYGCRKCGNENKIITSRIRRTNHIVKNTDDLIAKLKGKYGVGYVYDKTIFKNIHTPFIITCVIHGDILFNYKNIYNSNNRCCRQCVNDSRRFTRDEYIERAKKIHGDRYDYSLVDYSKYRDMVSIICKEHGVFTVDGAEFIHNTRSVSCPSCRGSRGEKEIIRILNGNSISFIKEYNFKTHAKFKYDFYLQDLNILIEYDGVQHYKPVSVFGGIDAFIQQKKRDKLKNMLAKEKNISLIRIPYTTKNIQNYLVNKISLIKKKQCPL